MPRVSSLAMMKYTGTITALVTPFLEGRLDEEGLKHLVGRQVAAGVQGVLVLGTTGEAPTLSSEEQMRVISFARKECKEECLLWVGTGSYSTSESIAKIQKAERLGADVALVVTPYYNKPSQEGLYLHFKAVAESSRLPIVIYNIEGRCARNIETKTLLRLAQIPNIVGVKEASGNVNQMADVVAALQSERPEFAVLSGDDGLTLPLLALGGRGVVSVVSNLVPEMVCALVEAGLDGRFAEARAIHSQLLPLFRAAFIDVNPVPVKEALKMMGLPSGGVRLPLCEMASAGKEILKSVLEAMELMSQPLAKG